MLYTKSGVWKNSSLGFQFYMQKDKNIIIENKLDLINIDGQDTFLFHGALSYEPKCCTNCGCIKKGNNIVKNGLTELLKSSNILYIDVNT